MYSSFNLSTLKREKMLIKYTLNILISYLNILFIVIYTLNFNFSILKCEEMLIKYTLNVLILI